MKYFFYLFLLIQDDRNTNSREMGGCLGRPEVQTPVAGGNPPSSRSVRSVPPRISTVQQPTPTLVIDCPVRSQTAWRPEAPVGNPGKWITPDAFLGGAQRKSFGWFQCHCGHRWISAHAVKSNRRGEPIFQQVTLECLILEYHPDI